MIYRIFASKDTFITSYRRFGTPQTASNAGASEILYLFKQAAITASLSASVARVLVQFDLSEFTALSASGGAPLSGTQFRLRLADAQHANTLPSSYDVEVQAVAQDWDEGRGQDLDNFSDKGFANWDKAKSNVFWAAPGSSGSGVVAHQHFDTGHEDLDLNVTQIVESWLSGNLTNYGFLAHVSSTQEADLSDYYIKMFYSRQTHFPDQRPYLEAAWDDSVQTGSLSQATSSGQFFVAMPNLKSRYTTEESPILRLFVRDRSYNPSVVLTASSDANGLAVANAYYRITNDRTSEVVVPFGTGSTPTTKISYDSHGNYFKFYMKSLSPSEVYRIVLLFDVGGQKQIIDEGFKFRVT